MDGTAVRGQEGEPSEAERFVTDTLFPFLLRCRPLKQPTTLEVAALVWGHQSGRGQGVSPFEVANILRKMIAASEPSDEPGVRSVRGLVEALSLVEAAMPEVAATFWHA